MRHMKNGDIYVREVLLDGPAFRIRRSSVCQPVEKYGAREAVRSDSDDLRQTEDWITAKVVSDGLHRIGVLSQCVQGVLCRPESRFIEPLLKSAA